jgi:hypothetical protein
VMIAGKSVRIISRDERTIAMYLLLKRYIACGSLVAAERLPRVDGSCTCDPGWTGINCNGMAWICGGGRK